MMRFAITNPHLLLMIGLAERPEIGFRQASQSAGYCSFALKPSHHTYRILTPFFRVSRANVDIRFAQEAFTEFPSECHSLNLRLVCGIYKVLSASRAYKLVRVPSVLLHVAIFAGALSAGMLDLDARLERDRLTIIADMTLIIASLMLSLGSLGDFDPLE